MTRNKLFVYTAEALLLPFFFSGKRGSRSEKSNMFLSKIHFVYCHFISLILNYNREAISRYF